MEMIQVKQEPDESIQCFMCSESFEDNTHLEEHKKSLCCIKALGTKIINGKKECEDDEHQDLNLMFYECLHCGEIVNDVEDVVKHHESHINLRVVKKENFNPPDAKSFAGNCSKKDEERCFSCSVCGKKFTQQGHLNRHKRIHTGEKLYVCKECGKDFSRKYTLKRHLLSHKGERPFTCEQCQKSFSQRQHLIKHLRIHTGEKPFTCDICNKGFGQRSTLERHQSTHTSERPFACDVCKQRFSRFGSLKRHQIIHTGMKPYQCDVCKKSFNRASYLPVHKRMHEKQ